MSQMRQMSQNANMPAPATAQVGAASSSEQSFARIDLPETIDPVRLLGPADRVLRIMERGLLGLQVSARGSTLLLSGPAEPVKIGARLLEELITLGEAGDYLDVDGVQASIEMLREADPQLPAQGDVLNVSGKLVRAKTPGQRAYAQALEEYAIVFGVGPAGTGKTYLAMARAVQQLLTGKVRRIVLTRPAVEAGESLGFLPGTLTEKIDPYLRPLYDALRDLVEEETLSSLMDSGAIEVAPLAYMRGRTLNDSFVILDEAQNTTPSQMKMFLTRLGFGSQMVVTGDISQIDLGVNQTSGLTHVQRVLQNVGGVKFCYLTSEDVVRNSLVTEIVDAYEQWDARQMARQQRMRGRKITGRNS